MLAQPLAEALAALAELFSGEPGEESQALGCPLVLCLLLCLGAVTHLVVHRCGVAWPHCKLGS